MRRKGLVLFTIFLFSYITLYAQKGVTRVYTDYNGYWTSGALTDMNPVKPDNQHNLLGFTRDGSTYSTGVNDALLRSRGVNFTPGIYQAFPVANIPLNGLNANYVALGYMEDGSATQATYGYPLPVKISYILTRGINGLDLGSAITNIPATAEPLQFNFGQIKDPRLIGDRIPDILISQVASPGSNNLDKVWFEDVNHQRVGVEVTINMFDAATVPPVGTWTLDLFNPLTGISPEMRSDRQIRIWAADASLFGLTQSNYTQPLYLRYKLGGASDPAFLAFNREFIDIITANDDDELAELNTPVNINVLENDGPAAAIDPNSITIVTPPRNGSALPATVNGQRVVIYTPNNGYEGEDTFTYRIANIADNPTTDEASVTIKVGSADVSIVKTVSNSSPYVGNNVIFSILITNNGTGTASQISLRDQLPAGYTYVSRSSGSSYNTSNRTLTQTIATLRSGESRTITLEARVNATGPYANTATTTATSRDNNLTNNTSTVTTTPLSLSDLSVTKTIDQPNTLTNGTVVFTLTARNAGPTDATGIIVTDLLPSGYTLISTSPSTAYDANTGIWQIGNLARNASPAILTMTARINATGEYNNTAVIKGDQPDENLSNNTSSAAVNVVDLNITKTVSNPSPYIGDELTFTIRVNNPSNTINATAVKVEDILPAGYTFISSTPNIGAFSKANSTWTIGSLAAGGTGILTIKVRVNTTGPYPNTAIVTSNTPDPILANNTSTVQVTPIANADLSIVKTLNNSALNNKLGIFTLVARNNGPNEATNIRVTDQIPSGYTYSSFESDYGNYDPVTHIWTIDRLSVGSSATLTLNTNLNPSGDFVNRANIIGDIPDLVPENNNSFSLPAPTAPSGAGTQGFCEINTPTVAMLVLTGTNIKWYGAATAGIQLDPATTLIDGGSYFASQTIGGIESRLRYRVNVKISVVPPPTTTSTIQSFCEGGGAILANLRATGMHIKWYTEANGGSLLPENTLLVNHTTYYASQTIDDCESKLRLAITIDNEIAPVPIPGGDQTVCENSNGTTLTAKANTTAGYSIVWYTLDNQIVTDPILSSPGTVTYYAGSKNDITGCVSLSKTPVVLTINPAPAKPVSGGDQTECPNSPLQTLTASATAPVGSSVVWYDAATMGNIVSPVLNATGTVTYYAAAKDNNTGCESLERTAVVLTLYSAVEATINITQPVCTERTATVKINSALGTTFSLTGTDPQLPAQTNTNGTFTAIQPGNYALVITSANGCILTVSDIRVNKPSCPEITLTKAAMNQVSKAGDVINYTLTVENTGNVPLTNINVLDQGVDAGSISPGNVNLQPGQIAIFTARYSITQTDVNAGSYSNQASVTGVDPDGNTTNDPASDDPNTATENDPTVVNISPYPAIRLVKTGLLTEDYETVNYVFTIQNTGNVTLNNINIKDDKLGLDQILQSTLEPGASISTTQSYTLTVADKRAGSTSNTAVVYGQSPSAGTVSDVSGSAQDNDQPTVVLIPNDAAIALVKLAVVEGNLITYSFTVTNTGRLSLRDLRFTDVKLGIRDRLIEGILFPGGSTSFTESYTLVQADRELGRVTNTAQITGLTPAELIVRDQSGSKVDNDEPTIVPVARAPIAVNDRAETKANAPVLIDILDNDDPINSRFDPSTVVIVDQPRNGLVRVNSDGTVTYTPLPGFTGEDSFTYHVTDIEGYQTNNALVSINANFFNLIIPNTITPNGDGINDTFKIPGLNQYADNELVILSRWGNEVFRIKNYQDSWDAYGLAEGTYFYSLKVKRKDTQKFETLRGWILVKRSFVN
jgi:uncharacterized repeat protein (TIGR01451 family)/gliding motility-associated-like protein